MKTSELIRLLSEDLDQRGDLDVLATGESCIDWCDIEGLMDRAQLGGKQVTVIDVGASRP